MKNEVLKAELLDNEISVIEQSHKSAILSIHENMQQLVNDCLTIQVTEDDKEIYDRALELKRVVKATHVAIEKKRKELKQPLIDYGKRLDRWVEEIYTPLVNAEKIVKKKMEVYEAKQEELKKQRKIEEEEKQAQEQKIEEKLKDLNSILGKINSAKSKNELTEINTYLDEINLSEFGKKSDEAGFILNQLKLTCSMVFRLMKDEEEKPVEAPKLESTPITDDLLEGFKESIPEPAKVVVIENEVADISTEQKEDVQEVLMKNDEGIFEEIKIPIYTSKRATDDDVINIIEYISNETIPFVINLIIEKTTSLINNSEAFNQLDFSERKELIISEVKHRIGILLKK